jgi:hypothetical protein
VIFWLGYEWMITAVDRGGIMEAQLARGGRISNFLNMLNVISGSNLGEFTFGRGMGVGTNTAYGMLLAAGKAPEAYRFNWLIDNAFLTQFFQLGALGSLVFWIGLGYIFVVVKPAPIRKYRRRYWVVASCFFAILWAGSPFEHYFLMMAFFIALGSIYWTARAEQRELYRSSSQGVAN